MGCSPWGCKESDTTEWLNWLTDSCQSCWFYILKDLLSAHAQLCQTLCNPMDCSPPLSVDFPLQEYWSEWVAISYPRGSSRPRDQTGVSCFGSQILYHWATWEAICSVEKGNSNRAIGSALMGKYMELNQDILFWLKWSYEASQRRAIGFFVLTLVFLSTVSSTAVVCSSTFAYLLAFSGSS